MYFRDYCCVSNCWSSWLLFYVSSPYSAEAFSCYTFFAVFSKDFLIKWRRRRRQLVGCSLTRAIFSICYITRLFVRFYFHFVPQILSLQLPHADKWVSHIGLFVCFMSRIRCSYRSWLLFDNDVRRQILKLSRFPSIHTRILQVARKTKIETWTFLVDARRLQYAVSLAVPHFVQQQFLVKRYFLSNTTWNIIIRSSHLIQPFFWYVVHRNSIGLSPTFL